MIHANSAVRQRAAATGFCVKPVYRPARGQRTAFMQQLNLQLYGRPADADFSEQLSSFRSVMLSPDPLTVELVLEATGKQAFVELRLDPDDKPSTFVLHGLALRSRSGAQIYRWDGSPESLGEISGMRVSGEHGEAVVESLGNDPFLLIPLAEPLRDGVVVEVTASQPLLAGDRDESLADAVRSLRTSLRAALDDLAAEQEGLQDALTSHHAHARAETRDINERMAQLLDRTERLEQLEGRFSTSLTETAKQIRDLTVAEVRDDWRSVRRQIAEVAEAASRHGQERHAELTASIQAEFAAMTEALHRLRVKDELLAQVRHELGVASDEESLGALRQLRTEAEQARNRLQAMESTASWRITRPLRSAGALFKAPRKP